MLLPVLEGLKHAVAAGLLVHFPNDTKLHHHSCPASPHDVRKCLPYHAFYLAKHQTIPASLTPSLTGCKHFSHPLSQHSVTEPEVTGILLVKANIIFGTIQRCWYCLRQLWYRWQHTRLCHNNRCIDRIADRFLTAAGYLRNQNDATKHDKPNPKTVKKIL